MRQQPPRRSPAPTRSLTEGPGSRNRGECRVFRADGKGKTENGAELTIPSHSSPNSGRYGLRCVKQADTEVSVVASGPGRRARDQESLGSAEVPAERRQWSRALPASGNAPSKRE